MTDSSWVPVPSGSPFPIANLPLGIGRLTRPDRDADGTWRAWAAIGDSAFDLAAADRAGAFSGIAVPPDCFADASLNRYLAAGPTIWSAVRARLTELLATASRQASMGRFLIDRSQLTMGIPTAPVDYVDFYSSIHHATNLGRLFRPDGEALMPNWKRIPIGYHGRTGTIVADRAEIARPHGMRSIDGEPQFGPCRSLDIELEVGTVIGVGSERGTPIRIEDAGSHLYGMCLVNDWSARDIQAFEYQPLGPFLGKSFATSVSPWLVSFEALEPYRVASPVQDPPVADYLSTDQAWGFDLHLEVLLETATMRAAGQDPICLSRVPFADMYWTPAQQLAHLTVNGASTNSGDLFASGTVSGPTVGSEGSMIELSWNGGRPIELPDGSARTFLQDGDRVTLTGWAGTEPAHRIGLGSVSGTITQLGVVPGTTPNSETRED